MPPAAKCLAPLLKCVPRRSAAAASALRARLGTLVRSAGGRVGSILIDSRPRASFPSAAADAREAPLSADLVGLGRGPQSAAVARSGEIVLSM